MPAAAAPAIVVLIRIAVTRILGRVVQQWLRSRHRVDLA
jgi:hypothetical protein